MGLFGYYAWHSVKNQLKKLFKTWVLVFFVVCCLIGGVLGFTAATLEDAYEDETDTEDTVYEEDIQEQTPWDLEIQPLELTELIVGGIVLAAFVLITMGADKSGSSIFLPADVPVLFASPLKPQSVLVFRLGAQLGTIALLGVYYLFQIPSLMNMGLSVWAALAGIATFCMVMLLAKLFQVLLYTVCSTRIQLKKYLRPGIFGFVGLLGLAFYLFWSQSGHSPLAAANAMFNGDASRWIPFWGWTKGFLMSAIENQWAMAALYLLANILAGGVLVYVIWHIKADFYEEAMAKSQETAALLEQAQESSSVVVAKRKKDRSEKLRRDSMHHGSGANMFFFKAMYNRFRFAYLYIFTKTSVTYLLVALGVAALCRFILAASCTIPAALVLGVMIFYRALGNDLSKDVQTPYFLLVPESTGKKLLYALLGSSANCLLDLLPAMLACPLLAGESVLGLLVWLPLLLSVDFFSTNAAAFLEVSIPKSVDKTIRQIILVMFVYFGLLPDILIMAFGITLGHTALAAVLCCVVNCLLGLLFFALIPSFVAPQGGKKSGAAQAFSGNLRQVRRHFSWIGASIGIFLATRFVFQLIIRGLLEYFWPQWMQNAWALYGVSGAAQYIPALPVMLLVLKKAPATPMEKSPMKVSHLAVAAFVAIFMMQAGNLVGNLVSMLLSMIPSVAPSNPVSDLMLEMDLLPTAVFAVLFAPLMEELIFRKVLIDRMHVYGQKTAVILSALIFGLFHGNPVQFTYAFTVGLVLGFVYVKTGKLRYSIALHMLLNFLGGGIAPWLLKNILALDIGDGTDLAAVMAALPWVLGLLGYLLTIFASALAGLVLLIVNRNRITFENAPLQLPRKKSVTVTCCNVGMLFAFVLLMAEMVLNML